LPIITFLVITNQSEELQQTTGHYWKGYSRAHLSMPVLRMCDVPVTYYRGKHDFFIPVIIVVIFSKGCATKSMDVGKIDSS